MEIDFAKLDPKVRKTIELVESKGHVKYIRYLLTKRYAPSAIRNELQRLGLSSPHEPVLGAYYFYVIDPLVKKLGLSYLYADYKGKLAKKGKACTYSKDILNYRVDLGTDLDGQVKLCKLVKALDLEELWIKEIHRFHGSATNLPVDETGNRILSVTGSFRQNLDNILLSEKRYLIDKLLLENIPVNRITQYCRENLKLTIQSYDIETYRKVFFNIRVQTIEEKIEILQAEKNSLNQLIQDIRDDNPEYAHLSFGEKTSLIKQTEQRIADLSDNIKTLNMIYSDFAIKVAEDNQNDFEKMFSDVVSRAYKRYTHLDGYKDRDVVDPLFKTARIMSFAHDKVENIRINNKSLNSSTDRHSQSVLMELYKQRIDDITDEQKIRAANELGHEGSFGDVELDNIEGIDELGVSYETKDEE